MTLSIYSKLHPVVKNHVVFVERWKDYFFKNYPEEVKKKIQNGACLDAGCGGTVKGVHLIKKFSPASVMACDLNNDHAKEYTGIEKVDFVHCDIASLPFEDSHFDFVLCNGALHHMPDPDKGMQELHRVLKPDGMAHIAVYCFKYSPFHLFVNFLRMLAKTVKFNVAEKACGKNFVMNILLDHAYVPHEFIYTKKEFVNKLQEAGFSVEGVLNVSDSRMDGLTAEFFTRTERIFFGDGAILSFLCRKNCTTADQAVNKCVQ